MNQSKALQILFSQVPIMQKLSTLERARLASIVIFETYAIDDIIFTPPDSADFIYYIVTGEILLKTPNHTTLRLSSNHFFGEEAGLRTTHYTSEAIVKSPASLIKIPRHFIEELLACHPKLQPLFSFTMFKKLGNLELSPRPEETHSTPHETSIFQHYFPLIGWFLSLALPIFTYLVFSESIPNDGAKTFLSLLSSALCMWVFGLIDPYIPGLFLLLSALALGVAPPNIILSGYSSPTFFMALSIIALGSAIVNSGILYRLLLYIMTYLPATPFWTNASLFALGTLLTPAVPAAASRNEVVAPFLKDFLLQTNTPTPSPAATQLSISAFFGINLFSAVFLSSSIHNFILLGLLWAQDQETFQWLGWLQSAAIPGLILLIGFWIPMGFILNTHEKPTIDRIRIQDQLKALGPITSEETLTFLCFILFTIGVVTSNLHRTPPEIIGLMILLILLVFNVLNKKTFRDSLDWPSLFLLGSLIGIIGVFNFLELNHLFIQKLDNLGNYIKKDFHVFTFILITIIFLVRLIVPYAPTVIILATIFVPLAQKHGANPWVICFIILLIGKMWFYPTQYPPYLEFKSKMAPEVVFQERSFIYYNLYMNLVKIGAVYLSIPYWKNLGIL